MVVSGKMFPPLQTQRRHSSEVSFVQWLIYNDTFNVRDHSGKKLREDSGLTQESFDQPSMRQSSSLSANDARVISLVNRRGSECVQLNSSVLVQSAESSTLVRSTMSRTDSLNMTSSAVSSHRPSVSENSVDDSVVIPENCEIFDLSPVEMAVELGRLRIIEEFFKEGMRLSKRRAIELAEKAYQRGSLELILPIYELSSDLSFRREVTENRSLELRLNILASSMINLNSPFTRAAQRGDVATMLMISKHVGMHSRYIFRAIEFGCYAYVQNLIQDSDASDRFERVSIAFTPEGQVVSTISVAIKFEQMAVLELLLHNGVGMCLSTVKLILQKETFFKWFRYLLVHRSQEFILLLCRCIRYVVCHEYNVKLVEFLFANIQQEERARLYNMMVDHFCDYEPSLLFAKFVPILDSVVDYFCIRGEALVVDYFYCKTAVLGNEILDYLGSVVSLRDRCQLQPVTFCGVVSDSLKSSSGSCSRRTGSTL